MVHQALLISYLEGEVAQLRSHLIETRPGLTVNTALNMRQGFERLAQQPCELIVTNFDNLGDIVFKHVRNLRSVIDKTPLMVLGKVQNPTLIQQISQISNTHVLDKPCSEKDFKGVAHKIFNEEQVYQRFHRRFATEEKAFLEIYGKNIEAETRLLNLSKGGAYLEIPARSPIKVGDLLRINVDLKETHSAHRMHGRVVWTRPVQAQPDSLGLGVAFIRAADVFREMQNR